MSTVSLKQESGLAAPEPRRRSIRWTPSIGPSQVGCFSCEVVLLCAQLKQNAIVRGAAEMSKLVTNQPSTTLPAVMETSDNTQSMHLRILVADDHHLVREGLKLALRQIERDVIVLEADTLNKAILICRENPELDLVLLDLNMPGSSGLASLDGMERACPDARVVVISAAYDMHTVQAAIRRGVLGFIPKLAGKDTLLSALRFVLAGGIYVPPEMFLDSDGVTVAGSKRPKPAAPAGEWPSSPEAAGLTARQVDVLRLLFEGKSNKQICRDLNLAIGTVKGHVAAVLHALAANTRAEAVAAVNRMGWSAILMERSEIAKYREQ